MIGERVVTLLLKVIRKVFGALARRAINDAAFAFVFFEKVRELAFRLVLQSEIERDVGPIETVQEELWRRGKKSPGDVLARRGVGRGGEADRLDVAERFGGATDLAIFRTEIMAPFRNAMGFVDGEASRPGAAQIGDQPVHHQALGRDIEQPQRAVSHRAAGFVILFRAVHGVERRRRNAERPHLLHLIAHQRDERRDDHRERAFHDRGKLIAHRFAAAGRHDREHRPATQHGGDDLGLTGAEVVIAENRFEQDARLRGKHGHGGGIAWERPTRRTASCPRSTLMD